MAARPTRVLLADSRPDGRARLTRAFARAAEPFELRGAPDLAAADLIWMPKLPGLAFLPEPLALKLMVKVTGDLADCHAPRPPFSVWFHQ